MRKRAQDLGKGEGAAEGKRHVKGKKGGRAREKVSSFLKKGKRPTRQKGRKRCRTITLIKGSKKGKKIIQLKKLKREFAEELERKDCPSCP